MAKIKGATKPVSKRDLEPQLDVDETSIAKLSPELKETLIREECIAKMHLDSDYSSQPARISLYTECPATLIIGRSRICYYAPRHILVSTPWSKVGLTGIALPDVDVDTGHTLVHYLYTGAYQTLDYDGNSPTLKADSDELKRALQVYIMTITYNLPDLRQLATLEIEDHGARLGILEILEAIKDDFEKLNADSWIHGYLQKKAQETFELSHTVFKSDAFLDFSDDNAALNKFMMKCVMEIYDDKISQMLNTEKEMSQKLDDRDHIIQNWSVKETVPVRNTEIREDFITPPADEHTMEEECSGQETFEHEIVSTEEFCTISCPSSECSVETLESRDGSAEYLEKSLDCGSDIRLDESKPDERCYASDVLFPGDSVLEIQALVEEVATIETFEMSSNEWEEKPKEAEPVPKPEPGPEPDALTEFELLETSFSPTTSKESSKKPSKKGTLKQRKDRQKKKHKKRERQKSTERQETSLSNRKKWNLDAAKAECADTKLVPKFDYDVEVQPEISSWATGWARYGGTK